MIRIVVSLVLLVSAWQSFTVLAGGTLHRMVMQELEGRADIAFAIERLQLALRIDPGNPSLLSLLARLQPPAESLTTLRLHAKVAPADPEVWAGIFSAKMRLGELDSESRSAIDAAIQLGPYEPLVAERLVDAGSRRWLLLDAYTRQQIVEMAVRALESRAEFRKVEIGKLLASRGLLDMVCTSVRVAEREVCGQSASQ